MIFIKNNRILCLAFLLSIFLLTLIVFFDTWASIADIWMRSETFTHGFFVIPASIWLVWQNKQLHAYLYPSQPSYTGLSFILLNGLIWLLSSLTQTLVIQQYALVGMLVGSIWFYLGNSTVKKILFPLAFLYFMVPVGEALFPFLMEYTATFTIALLRLTGINVYREGMHFTLVSGQWSVIEACSGLRYLIASFTLGIIYAYVSYTHLYKRIIFTLFSIILPIIANGFRAYLIVMIGHLSDMKLAVGVDHVIYGAIFFGIIIFFMFYLGSYWKDPLPEPSDENESNLQINTYTVKQYSLIALTLVLSLSLWPVSKYQLLSHYQAQTNIPEWPPLTNNNHWQKVEAPNWGWQPNLEGAANESLRYYKNNSNIVGFYQVNFGDEKQGSELINTQNKLISSRYSKQWHSVNQSTIHNLHASIDAVDSIRIRNNYRNKDIMTVKWYKIGKFNTNNIYAAKIYQLFKRLTLNTDTEIYNLLFFKVSINTDINETEQIIDGLNKPNNPIKSN